MQNQKEKIYTDIFNVLNQADKILIITHPRPDGDALGSAVAFYRWLNNQGKTVKLFIDDIVSSDFNFLPHIDKIENNHNIFWQHEYDAFLILDIGEFERSGVKNHLEKISYQPQLINIDHHPVDNFGHCNLVNTNVSCVAEMAYDFFNFCHTPIDVATATALLTGIITDTDFFVNPNTSYQCLKIAGDLIKKGAKLNLILDNIYKTSSIKSLKLWGKALARLNLDPKNELATTAVFEDDLEDVRASDSELVGLANFLNSLSDVKGAMILKEDGSSLVKGSLRTTRNDIDVSEIAKQYGGGGHMRAAGFRTSGRIVKDEKGNWRVSS